METAKQFVDAHSAPVRIHAAVPVTVTSPARSVSNSATCGAVILDVARSARNLVRLVWSVVLGIVHIVENAPYLALFLAIYCLVLHAVRNCLRVDTSVLRYAARYVP